MTQAWRGALKNRRDCREKRSFPNQKAALAAIQAKAWNDDIPTLRTYKCSWCAGWHHTSKALAQPAATGEGADDELRAVMRAIDLRGGGVRRKP